MKKILVLALILVAGFTLIGCDKGADYSGVYTGYSWKDESKGVAFEDATEYIESKMTLSKSGIILDFELDFKVKTASGWVSRLNQTSTVSIDFTKTPTIASVGTETANGQSMFTIQTTDFMSFYAYGVSSDHVVALAIVDPVTRYIFETRLEANFDYNLPISDINVGNGLSIPTIRTSSSGLIKPTSWSNYQAKNIFNISVWSHVLTEAGVFSDVSQTTTVKQLLEQMGVTFVNGLPVEKAASYGFSGIGGWVGNYQNIRTYLIGKSALEVTSLVDWTIPKYSVSIDESNFFGLAAVAGGTRTVQDSFAGIAGATVRMSREATSYQRVLVAAGIITEADVIKGRF